ncbi:MAG: hypothetical protein M3O31_18265 [Acidobacteriota bacterium]|nr:hypothetical protein [Acidobacteriota bacterium]
MLVFDGTASGLSTPYLEIPGWLAAVDTAGNLYVVSCFFAVISNCSPGIDVYSPGAVATGKPLRSLHPHLTSVYDMTVSKAGEIFVADGSGVAVFSPTAANDDAPVRYILLNQPNSIAVDSSDNLYVRAHGTISVFGPTATGAAAPARVIGGPQTQIRSAYAYDYGAVAVDADGKLYVLCVIDQTDGFNNFRVLEFSSAANGDVPPLRYVTTPGMTPAYDGTGIAVDATGTIYVSASLAFNIGAVFEFPPDAAGSVTPSNVISSSAWGENAGGIAVH